MEKMITEQEYIEATNQYRSKINMQRFEIGMLKALLSDTIKQANKDKFRYDNIRSLLNRYIATGLMPGYFDIYNQLCETKAKLKDARKEAAAANKRYKQLKKAFDQYRNEHTAKIRDLEQQIEAMNAHRERMNEFICYNCDYACRGIASDGTDELYCRASGEDPVCVSDVKVCPGFKTKEKPNE